MIETEILRTLIGFILGCILGGLFIFYFPFKKKILKGLKNKNNVSTEKTSSEKDDEKDDNVSSSEFFNGGVNFIGEHKKGIFTVRLTDYGERTLNRWGTLEEALLATNSFVNGFEIEIETITNSSKILTNFEKMASFRWYIHHMLERMMSIIDENNKIKNPDTGECLMKKALIVVDAQNDFMPGGSLSVPDGDKIVPVINAIQDDYDLVVFTQDFHPEDHCSFKENGGPWPAHCIQGTEGVKLHKDLNVGDAKIITKGLNTKVDSYSAFWDNNKSQKTELDDYLKENNITDVYISGLALNVCVTFTAKDSVDLGYRTHVLHDACKGIEIYEGAIDKAMAEMKEKGIMIEP